MKIYSVIWVVTLYTIPIINSGFFKPLFSENIRYFNQYWIWFLIIGIIFVILAIKIYSLAKKDLKSNTPESESLKLITKGIYKVVRHPVYLAWVLAFIGFTFMLDSFISLILCPFLILFAEINGFLEEKYVFIPKFGKDYEDYKEKIPYRIISPPYNYILIILTIFVVYIGFLNFNPIS